MIWTADFWRGCAERAVKTAAQTFVATVGVSAAGILDVDWVTVASVTALATVLSVVTSIGNAEFTAGSGTVVLVDHDDSYSDETDDSEAVLDPPPNTGGDLDDLEDMVAVVNEQ